MSKNMKDAWPAPIEKAKLRDEAKPTDDYNHEDFDKLTGEQQDHLFYALHEARAAADDYWTSEFGVGIPVGVELAVAEQYAETIAGRI